MTLAELTKLQRSKDLVAQIPEMHAEYQRVTRLNAPYRINYEYPWSLWLSEGWGKKELGLVVAHIRKRMKQGRRFAESLTFKNLICDRDKFAEDLSIATAENRAPRIDHERKFVLEATGRSAEPEPAKTMTPAQVMEQSKKLAAMLKEWREKNLTDDEEIPNQQGRGNPTQATRSGGGSH
jgi:hypothetical protein